MATRGKSARCKSASSIPAPWKLSVACRKAACIQWTISVGWQPARTRGNDMIRLSQVSKTYQKRGQEPVRALRDITLNIEKGECVAILGPSGSGKSTLMNMLGLLDHPDKGSYLLQEREVAGLTDRELAALRNRTIGF